ncbi:HAMP domain-containing sensor histidine kinase [Acidithrix sp. C25]|uniref:sensor histidine kinase n=1 Tax=Acidithrix sp. C25 TaxID=1671482 RepID=UPI00191BBF16|nr:HAMP domain-containing sensor histidine kinase [Acidithrix sp. C25]
MTLRTRLIALIVAVVLLGFSIADFVTYKSISSFLDQGVSHQLDSASFPITRSLASIAGVTLPGRPLSRLGGAPGGRGPLVGVASGNAAGTLFSPNQSSPNVPPAPGGRRVLIPQGTFGELLSPQGRVLSRLFYGYGQDTPSFPSIEKIALSAMVGPNPTKYFSITSTGSGAAPYSALVARLANGVGVVIIGVPMAVALGTLHRLLLVEAGVSLALLVALGAIAWFILRRDLRPLVEVANAAKEIAQGDLGRRVPEVGSNAKDEVVQLARSFNAMVAEIEGAFGEVAESEGKLRRFLADASHELGTPLSSILGYSDLFELWKKDDRYDLDIAFRHIREDANRMKNLVDDLFSLAQFDQERPLEITTCNLSTIAYEAVAALRVTNPNRTITLEGAKELLLQGDNFRLRQVIDILLVNATKHTPSHVAISLDLALEGSDAFIVVHDDGPGIDKDLADTIFQPFVRGDRSRQRHSGGAGLGLAIAQSIVTAHLGEISLEPGIGATFIVRIPIRHSQNF